MNPINYGKLVRVAGSLEGITVVCRDRLAEVLKANISIIDDILRSELDSMTRQEDDLK